MGKWADLAERLKERDARQVEEINDGGLSIESRIALAEGRATDALGAVVQILQYLDERDAPNAPDPAA